MIEQGWVEEVQALLDHGFEEHIGRLKALGYREIAAYLRGEQTLDAAIDATKMHHRRYAKRQIAWFRADPRVHWLPATAGMPDAHHLPSILALLGAPSRRPSPRLLPKTPSTLRRPLET